MQMFVTSYSLISLVVLAVAVQGGHTGGVIIRVACFQKRGNLKFCQTLQNCYRDVWSSLKNTAL
jgi:hypothetical protein